MLPGVVLHLRRAGPGVVLRQSPAGRQSPTNDDAVLPSESARSRRPGLDLVRTVAIALVLVQHIAKTAQPVGSVGVSVFFALSGYLITGLLLDELATQHRLRLRRFYVRRLARLTPALLTMVLGSALFLWGVGVGVSWPNAVSAVTYVKNVEEILSDRGDGLYGHTWSLAVEEHFYLVWPLLLVALYRRLSPERMLTAILGICALDLLLRQLLLATIRPSDNFFYEATPVRADALLLGCAGCVAVRLGWRPSWMALICGTCLLMLELFGPSALHGALLMSTFTGVAATLVVASSDVLSRQVHDSWWCRLCRAGADISYPLYLWHAPVIVIAILATHQDSTTVRVIAVCCAVVLSYASLTLVERPALAWLSGRRSAVRPDPLVT